MLRALLEGEPLPEEPLLPRAPDLELAPAPAGGAASRCGSGAGARRPGCARVARAGDGWLASAYNTTPEGFAAARAAWRASSRSAAATRRLPQRARHDVDLGRRGSRRGATECSRDVLAPLLKRDPDELRGAGLRRVRRSTARSSSPATPRPAASASTCGRWATSGGRLELVAGEVAPQGRLTRATRGLTLEAHLVERGLERGPVAVAGVAGAGDAVDLCALGREGLLGQFRSRGGADLLGFPLLPGQRDVGDARDLRAGDADPDLDVAVLVGGVDAGGRLGRCGGGPGGGGARGRRGRDVLGCDAAETRGWVWKLRTPATPRRCRRLRMGRVSSVSPGSRKGHQKAKASM